jgi:glycosyltransferase involved in cell wall biosynthesis
MDAQALDEFVIADYPAARASLRVAVVTETYPPEVNGVALTLARLVEGLQARNHDVQLIRPRQDAADAAGSNGRFHEVLLRGLPIPCYPKLRMGVPSKRALVKLWSLRRPDVVHIATEGPLGWSALQAAVHLKLPISSDFRTNFHAYSRHYGVGWLNRPIMAYLRKFHNRTGCTMVPTDALRRELAAAGFRRLEVVGRGVDTQRFSPAHRSSALRASWGAGDDELVIGHVGRLAPEKNLGVLLQACEALRAQSLQVRLVLVGDGPMRAELEARCPWAHFAGHRSGADLAAHFASLDLFLFPSLTETFGNVTTEAMASGVPVVAFAHAAAAQLIRHGENGLLAPCGDDAAFVQAARCLAADTVQRRALADAARQSACGWTWDGVVARFESVLSTVALPMIPARSAALLAPSA